MLGLKRIISSDVSTRDGIGIEFHDAVTVIVEIFRDDQAKTRVIDTFGKKVPLDLMEECIRAFKEEIPWEFQTTGDAGTVSET